MKFLASNDHGETNLTRQQLGQIATQVGVANTRLTTLLVAMDKLNKHLGLDEKPKLEVVEKKAAPAPWCTVSPRQEARINEIHEKLGTGFVTHEMMMHVTGVNRKVIANLLYSVEQDPNYTRVAQCIGSNKSMYKIVKNNE